MKRSRKHLTLRIAKLKEAIRRKFNSFKTGVVESEKFFESKYKPIISEIKKSNVTAKEELLLGPKKEEYYDEVKEEQDGDDDDSDDREFNSPPVVSPARETGGTSLDTLLSTPSGRETVSFYINRHFEHALTKEYMDLFMRDRGGKTAQIDHIYGPRFENGETLMVGNQKLDFGDDGSILIDGDAYEGTVGLYELLFKRVPDDYDTRDLQVYKEILLKTNAHKKRYDPSGQINRNTSIKYRGVIAKLFPAAEKKRGSGMQWKSTSSRDIIHWDDPNELVDRLRLLAMSTETGHTSHANEILNIIEELREGGFIKGPGNKRFHALLK